MDHSKKNPQLGIYTQLGLENENRAKKFQFSTEKLPTSGDMKSLILNISPMGIFLLLPFPCIFQILVKVAHAKITMTFFGTYLWGFVLNAKCATCAALMKLKQEFVFVTHNTHAGCIISSSTLK